MYPNSFFLPSSGVQRGSVFLGDGDPLSPTWTSVDGACRLAVNDSDLSKIPSQPIGYGEAEQLWRRGCSSRVEGGNPNLAYMVLALISLNEAGKSDL